MTQPERTDIDPQILELIGLTPQDVAEVNTQRAITPPELETQDFLDATEYQGRIFYATWGRIPTLGDLFVPHQGSKLDEIPDRLVATLNSLSADENPKKLEELRRGLMRFLQGFGEGALEDFGDWKTAINALDISTEGGITQNQAAMETFKGLSRGDKALGVAIAVAIQQRLDVRASGSTLSPTNP